MRPTPAPVGRRQGSRSRASIASSTESSSLFPPLAKNLMPLSGIGLWLAESTTPRSEPSTSVRYATAGVGRTPARNTSTPALASPATTAASRNSPDALVSRPTTATGRCPANAPASPTTWAAATERSRASSAVRSWLARPRTPSVPKSRSTGSPWSRMRIGPGAYAPGPGGDDSGLSALAVLRRLASLLQAGLAAFLCPRIAGEEAGLLQQ